MVSLFDSLTHPTLSGKSFGAVAKDASFESLSLDLKKWGFSGACAVGLAGVEGYDHEAYIKRCLSFPELVPVAGVHPQAKPEEFEQIKKLGFKAVKVHFRLSQVPLSSDLLANVFKSASEHGLPVFYCSYMHSALENYPTEDPFFTLVKALKTAPEAKVLLLHGGDVNVLRYGELVRFNPNLLLDLSFTILKFRGSSLDLDLKFLFSKLDRRICIGSDHPEFDLLEAKDRFVELAADIAQDKQENIGFRNLRSFLGI
jgi:predicted TIM-barrel fold metal-dependent hydrolase